MAAGLLRRIAAVGALAALTTTSSLPAQEAPDLPAGCTTAPELPDRVTVAAEVVADSLWTERWASVYDWVDGGWEVSYARANLGVGHLVPEEDDYWEWPVHVEFPVYEEPNGAPWGWALKGWIVPVGGEGVRRRLTRVGLVETGYETSTLVVYESRADGWMAIRLDPGEEQGEGMVWVHECHLDLGETGLRFEPWEERFSSEDISPLFFRDAVPHVLREGPATDARRIGRVRDGDVMEPIRVDGDWMQVRVKQPSDYCVPREDWDGRTLEGWVKWRGPEIGPWVWYFTRGLLRLQARGFPYCDSRGLGLCSWP